MDKKILIVQSIPEWLLIFRTIIQQEMPLFKGEVIYTDSFDEAVDIIPLTCELVVISSGMFHDKLSNYRELHGEIISDKEKSGVALAELAKKLNPKCKFYIFSEYEPEDCEFIDGFIQQHKHGNVYSGDVVKVLEKFI